MSSDLTPEEPWEHEISDLLGSLGMVDPPDGFIARAIDHRPLFAGRITLGLVGLVVVTLGAALTSGVLDRSSVVPELGALQAQHAAARAGGVDPSDGRFEPTDEAEPPIEPAPEMNLMASYLGEEDLRQAVYDLHDDSVSVFSQKGKVDFDDLPDGEQLMVDGVRAWADRERMIVVLEAEDSAVTIVGLTPEAVAEAVADVPRRARGSGLFDALNSLTRELGFADLD